MKIILLFVSLFFMQFSKAQQAPEPQHPVLRAALKKISAFNTEERKIDSMSNLPLGLHGEAEAKRRHDFFLLLDKEIRSINRSELSFEDEINAELLLYSFEDDISDYRFKSYLNPILSEGGFHTNITGIANTTFRNQKDVEDYLNRLQDIPRYMEEHFGLMRVGLKAGIAQPYHVVKSFNNTYEVHIVQQPEQSVFWKPFVKKPSSISEGDWQKNLVKAKDIVMTKAVAGYVAVKKFFEQEYLPKAPQKPGVLYFPNGLAFYQDRVSHFTTTDLGYDSIFNIGLQEVARIKAAMYKVKDDVGFKGDMKAFIEMLRTDQKFYPKTGEELLKEASFIAKKIDGKLPMLFGRLPRQPYGVEPVPEAIAPTYTAGRYSPAPIRSTRSGNY